MEAKINDLKKFILFYQNINGTTSLGSWSGLDTKKFVLEMGRQNFKPATINRTLATLKNFAAFLLEKKYLIESPVRWIKGPTEILPPPANLSDTELHRLRKAAIARCKFKKSEYDQPFRDKAILEAFLGTGLRVSEIADLKLSQIKGKRITDVKCKGDKYRSLSIKSDLSHELSTYISEYRIGESDYLFTSNAGLPLSRRNLHYVLEKIADQANTMSKSKIKIWPHLLRHVHAKRVRDKFGDCYAAARLGHANTNYINRYAGYSEVEESRMVEELDI